MVRTYFDGYVENLSYEMVFDATGMPVSGWVSTNGSQLDVKDLLACGYFDDWGSTPTYSLSVSKSGAGQGSIASSPAGISCGSTCSYSFSSGTSVTLSATPSTGSTFTGWSGACSGASTSCTVTMDAAKTVSADFNSVPKANQTISFGAPPVVMVGGTGTLSATASSGLPVSFSSSTTEICTLLGSTVSGIAPGTCTIAANQAGNSSTNPAAQVTQSFAIASSMLTVSKAGAGFGSVSSSPAGINCGATCAAHLASGTVVTLTATPSAGSTFTGWSGACSGTGQCVLTLNAAARVSAEFIPPPFVVSTQLQISPTSSSLNTQITFNPSDLGKTGAVFVVARVPASALLTLPMAPSSKVAADLKAATTPDSIVTIQLTAAGWSIIENGQLLPYANGVLGDLLAAQKILDSADPRLLPGAQFCVGYGTSADEMLHNDRLQLIAVIPGGGVAFSGSCLDVDNRGKAAEFYESALKHYFITIDPSEAAGIDAGAAGAGWARTGGSFKVFTKQATGSQPVCRFYGSFDIGPNSHFFTVSAEECAALRAQQAITPETVKKWHYENTAFYLFTPINGACTGNSTPVYRYYNNGFARGEDSNHRLTTDPAQRTSMEAAGWGYEGIVMCAP